MIIKGNHNSQLSILNSQFSNSQLSIFLLYNRQRYALYFLVYIERKHIGHARNEVYDSHDTGLEVGAVDVILVAESLAQLFRMKLFRAYGSLNQGVHKRLHNLITRQFHVQNGLGVVYALYAEFGAMAVGIAH